MCEVVGEESKSINPLNNLLLSPDAILIIISEIIINKYRYFLSKRTALRPFVNPLLASITWRLQKQKTLNTGKNHIIKDLTYLFTFEQYCFRFLYLPTVDKGFGIILWITNKLYKLEEDQFFYLSNLKHLNTLLSFKNGEM